MELKPFGVQYSDESQRARVFCCYAQNAYEARLQAQELVQEIHDHPSCIDHIRCEETNFDW